MSLHVFEILLIYCALLVLGIQHNDSVFLCFQNGHRDRSSYHLSQYKYTTWLLTLLITLLHVSYTELIFL